MNVMKIIIYASQYGSTKQYADELSKRTGIETVEYTEVRDINQYDTIVYLGPLYAGSIMGLKKTLNKIRNVQDKVFEDSGIRLEREVIFLGEF